jgi:ribose 1,5-bisphosphokinase
MSSTIAHTGTLFYLMGASGVGKDSLLHYLRSHLPAAAPVRLPRRYITRPANSGGEVHIEISPEEFRQKLARDEFAMHWQSHGFFYGIDREIDHWLGRGEQVVINGSRHYLQSARQAYPTLQPILVSVSQEILRRRLLARGREDTDAIERRLQRGELLNSNVAGERLYHLDNEGPLAVAGEVLLGLILESCARPARVIPRSGADRA